MSLPPFLFSSPLPASPAQGGPLSSQVSSQTFSGARVGGADSAQSFRHVLSNAATPTAADSPKGGIPSPAPTQLEPIEVQLDDLQAFLAGGKEGITVDLSELPPEWRQLLSLHDLTGEMGEAAIGEEAQPLSLEQIVSLLTHGNSFPQEKQIRAAEVTEDENPDETTLPFNLFPLEQVLPLAPDTGAPQLMPESALAGGSRSLISAVQAQNSESPVVDEPLELLADSEDLLDVTTQLLKGASSKGGEDGLNISSSGAPVDLKTNFARVADSISFAAPLIESPDGSSAAATISTAARPILSQDAAAARITLPMQVSFGHAQWSEALAERAGWLASQQIHSAELQLDPPELGPLQVKINVQNDQAVVSFTSANPHVRDALEQSMVRLREMLQEQGLQLVDAGVSDQHQRQGEQAPVSDELAAVAGAPEDGAEASESVVVKADASYGVDDFV